MMVIASERSESMRREAAIRREIGKPFSQRKIHAPEPSRCGTVLHETLRERYGVDVTAGCMCRAWIQWMNLWGPVGCREHLPEIVDAMLAEARRRNWHLPTRPVLSRVARLGDRWRVGQWFAKLWARRLVLRLLSTGYRLG